MATIAKKLAIELMKNGGRYGDDPMPFAIYRYENAMFGGTNYSVCYKPSDVTRLVRSPAVEDPALLWVCYGGLTDEGKVEIA